MKKCSSKNMKKCSNCGKEFDFDEATLKFESHFQDDLGDLLGELYDYFDRNCCADCAISSLEARLEDGTADEDEEGFGGPFCFDCGGVQDYPNCKWSCKRYDT